MHGMGGGGSRNSQPGSNASAGFQGKWERHRGRDSIGGGRWEEAVSRLQGGGRPEQGGKERT